MSLLWFFTISLFSCFALSAGFGFLLGRWYERTLDDTVPSRPMFVPERHRDRLVPVPLPGRRLAVVDPLAGRPSHLAVVADPPCDTGPVA